MISTIKIIVISALIGVVMGGALAGWQARPWDMLVAKQKVVEHKEKEDGNPNTGNSSTGNPNTGNQNTGNPIAKFDETTFHFGKMEYGTAMTHAFRVQNLGTRQLHIEVGSTTCKCTVGDLTANDIAPGSEAEVNLEWEAKSAPGPFRHGATLLTNDPENSQIELSVEGTVVESTTMIPSQLFFGNVHAGKTKHAELYLMAFLQEELKILSYHLGDEKSSERIQVVIEPCPVSELPNSEAHAGVRVRATLQADYTLGPIHDWLTVETNLAPADGVGEAVQDRVRKFNIPIVANVIGDISIFGSGWIAKRGLLKMGMIDSKRGKQSRLNIAIRGDHAAATELEIAGVEPKELRASLGARRVMGDRLVHVPLVVEVPAGTRAMTRRGEAFDEVAEIVISTSHPETPELRLRVIFAVHPLNGNQ